jgi:hypothetical protein
MENKIKSSKYLNKVHDSIVIISIVSILWGILEVLLRGLFGTHFPEEILIISWASAIIWLISYVLKRFDLKAVAKPTKVTLKTSFIILLILLLLSDLLMFLGIYVDQSFAILYVFAMIILPIISLVIIALTFVISKILQKYK